MTLRMKTKYLLRIYDFCWSWMLKTQWRKLKQRAKLYLIIKQVFFCFFHVNKTKLCKTKNTKITKICKKYDIINRMPYTVFKCLLIIILINLFLLPIFPPSSHSIVVFFFSVGLLSLMWHSQQVMLGVKVSSVSWQELLRMSH